MRWLSVCNGSHDRHELHSSIYISMYILQFRWICFSLHCIFIQFRSWFIFSGPIFVLIENKYFSTYFARRFYSQSGKILNQTHAWVTWPIFRGLWFFILPSFSLGHNENYWGHKFKSSDSFTERCFFFLSMDFKMISSTVTKRPHI